MNHMGFYTALYKINGKYIAWIEKMKGHWRLQEISVTYTCFYLWVKEIVIVGFLLTVTQDKCTAMSGLVVGYRGLHHRNSG